MSSAKPTMKTKPRTVEPPKRTALPERLPGALRFSDERDVFSAMHLIREIKKRRWITKRLEDETGCKDRAWGRKRAPGSWALAYIGFIHQAAFKVEKWYQETSDEDYWLLCGFEETPSYSTVYLRFAELEEFSGTFDSLAGRCIRHARQHTAGRVGRYVIVDGTEAETHSGLIHVCGASCPNRKKRSERTPQRFDCTPAAEAQKARQDAAAALDPVTEAEQTIPDSEEVFVDAPSGRRRKRPAREFTFKNGCRYRLLDGEAGMRRYDDKNGQLKALWYGYYAHSAVDYFTGAPLVAQLTSSSIQEYDSYDSLYERLYRALGTHAEAVVGDAGLAVESVFKQNTENGVASVFAFRRGGKVKRADYDCDLYDRHGIPRCQFCGGPTQRVTLERPKDKKTGKRKNARLLFTCIQRRTPDCSHATKRDSSGLPLPKRQALNCSANYRLLVPIWRNDDRYWALRQARQFEGNHYQLRNVFGVASKTNEGRPRRIGRGCSQLRASVALFIIWFRICLREGWFKSHRLGSRMRPTIAARVPAAKARFLKRRVREGLELPYGSQAVERGLGPLLPERPTFKTKASQPDDEPDDIDLDDLDAPYGTGDDAGEDSPKSSAPTFNPLDVEVDPAELPPEATGDPPGDPPDERPF